MLARYRATLERSPLEDLLTEALVDLLNRLTWLVRSFTVDLLVNCVVAHNPDSPALESLLSALQGAENLVWETQAIVQVGDHAGRRDISLNADDRPFLIIENKIRAPLTRREVVDDAELAAGETGENGTVLIGQLRLYRTWLERRTAAGQV